MGDDQVESRGVGDGSGVLRRFHEANPGFDLLSADLLGKPALESLDLGEAPAATLSELRRHRRLLQIGCTPGDVQPLQTAGLDSAHAIASIPERRFVAEAATIFGDGNGGTERARDVHRKARLVRARVRHLYANVKDTVASPVFRATSFANVHPELEEHVKSVPSYDDLFGDVDFCTCEHCRSILGPAAYFVDLMRITDEYITRPNSKDPCDHAGDTIPCGYRLEDRRPDLFDDLQLDCATTNTLLPYLSIVNGILARTVSSVVPTADVDRYAATAPYPFALPFHLPLERIRSYTDAMGMPLSELYERLVVPDAATGVHDADVLRTRLGLSVEQEVLVTTPAATPGDVAVHYGYGSDTSHVPFQGPGTVTVEAGSSDAVGRGVDFPSVVQVGQRIVVAGQTRTITQFSGTDTLLVDAPWAAPAADATYQVVPVNGIDVLRTFLFRSGMSRDDLTSLLVQDLDPQEIAAGSAGSFFVNATGEGLPPLVIGTTGKVERLLNVSLARLDRISRFVRLARMLSLPFADLQRAIRCSGSSEIEGALPTVATLVELHRRTGTSIDLLCGLWGELPATGRVDAANPQDAFDRVFNNPALLGGRSPYAPTPAGQPTLPFDPFDVDHRLHWIVDVDDRTGEQATIRSRLQAALDLSDDDATLLGRYALRLLTAKKTSLELDLPNLTWLYRLRAFARLADLGMDELFQLLCLLYYPERDHLDPPQSILEPSPGFVEDLVARAGWMKASPFTVYELQYVLLPGELGRSRFVDPGYTDAQLGPMIDSAALAAAPVRVAPDSFVYQDVDATESTLVFQQLVDAGFLTSLGLVTDEEISAETLAFAYHVTPTSFVAEGLIDAATSEAVYDELVASGVLVPVTGKGYATVDPSFGSDTSLDFLFSGDRRARAKRGLVRATLLMVKRTPDELDADVAHSVEILVGRPATPGFAELQANVALQAIAALLDTTVETLRALPPLLTPSGEATRTYLADLLTPLGGRPVPEDVKTLVATLARALYLVVRLRLTPAETSAIIRDPAPFGIADLAHPTFDSIQALDTFRALVERFQDTSNGLLGYLSMPAGTTRAARLSRLSEVTSWPLEQVEALAGYLWPNEPPEPGDYSTLAGVARMDEVFRSASLLAADAESVLALGAVAAVPVDDTTWGVYSALADSVLGAVAARFGSQAFPAVAERLDEALIEKRRDALLPTAIWLLNRTHAEIETPSDLYDFLLLDAEMEGCDATTKMAAAIGSVQAYMQRARMMLEPGVTDLVDIKEAWWDWMSSHRLWEVNRRVFLYPENYVVPELRSTQTALFRELRNQLRQNDVSEETVEEAYKTYFDGFTKVGDLVYCDAYRRSSLEGDPADADGTVYVFGRTNVEPYAFYYRTYTPSTAAWSEWVEIELPIPAKEITPGEAFGRLFISWVEREEVVSGGITGTNSNPQSTKTTAVVYRTKYSFLTHTRTWTSPQSTAGEHVAGFTPDTYGTKLIPAGTVDPRAAWWQKPYSLRVPAKAAASGTAAAPERLLIVAGPGYRVPDDPITVPPEPDRATYDDERKYRFDMSIYDSTMRAIGYQKRSVGQTAWVFLSPTDLLYPPLVEDHPHLVSLGYNEIMGDPRPYRAAIARPATTSLGTGLPTSISATPSAGWSLQVEESDSVIIDNFLGPTRIIDGKEGLNLLNGISATQARLTTVKNQPGWYVFDNGDDAYLLTAVDPGLRTISKILIELAAPPSGVPGEIGLMFSPYTSSTIAFADLTFAIARLTTAAPGVLGQRLFAGGVPLLLTLESQTLPEPSVTRFYDNGVRPPALVVPPLDKIDRLDFDGAYGGYFREVFFHTPFLVAKELTRNRRFDEARRWYQYVFDPTHPPEPGAAHANDRYWRYLPFRSMTIPSLRDILTNDAQIKAYEDRPFDPDVIADLRPVAYAKALVMAYLDNLLQWGDDLFAQDTRESVGSAFNLYMIAAQLLGPRPRAVGECPAQPTTTFGQIRARYPSGVPDFLIDMEVSPLIQGGSSDLDVPETPVNEVSAYFCTPENEDLLSYWDRVEERLYRIRHCMNIQGVVRRLAPFAPPLDPRTVVRGAASGTSAFAAAAQLEQAIPNYRFETMLERAKGLASTLVQLGSSLLAALEKQDAEAIGLLQVSQQQVLLDLTTSMKQAQIEEAAATGESLAAARAAARDRLTFYSRVLDQGLSEEELTSLAAMATATIFNVLAGAMKTISSVAFAVPNVGSPFAMTYGGREIGSALDAASGIFEIISTVATFQSNLSSTMGSYGRRAEEWELQKTLAQRDVTQMEAQIQANALQRSIFEGDLRVHLKTIEQTAAVAEHLRRKFTNQELYQWLAGQLSALYFQAYSVALEMARAAERAYQYELDSAKQFVSFGYWDAGRRGLAAGEGLLVALQQMEQAYVTENVRRLDVLKQISLLRLDPKALLDLRETGECSFALPEILFDQDYPGHYARKVKSISVTIPGVVGPYQNVKATLTQTGNQVLVKPNVDGVRFLLGEQGVAAPATAVLRSNWWVNQQIALSRGVDDTGVPANESDGRYLPFEGTGAVSTWRLSMPPAANRLDPDAVNDVVITLEYSARDGGRDFRDRVAGLSTVSTLSQSQALFLAQTYPSEWYAFLHDHGGATQTMEFSLPPGVVPAHVTGARLTGFYVQLDTTLTGDAAAEPFVTFAVTDDHSMTLPLPKSNAASFVPDPAWGNLKVADMLTSPRTLTFDPAKAPSYMTKKVGNRTVLDPEVLTGMTIVLYLSGSLDWGD